MGVKKTSEDNAEANKMAEDQGESTADLVGHYFGEGFLREMCPERAAIIVDQRIIENLIEERQHFQEQGNQRHLYYGSEGAANWLNLCRDDPHVNHGYINWIRAQSPKLACRAGATTIVSLGPGDGKTDLEMMRDLCSRTTELYYIPVDISEPLLKNAISLAKDIVSIPFAILGDFEEGLDFIAKQLLEHGKGPFLLTLLGGTLGNFSKDSQTRLLTKLKSFMRTTDCLMIGVSLAGDGWQPELDPRCNLREIDLNLRRFLCASVARSFSRSIDSCVSAFEDAMQLRNKSTGDGLNEPSHQVMEYWWIERARPDFLCLRICRYSLEKFICECRDIGFEIRNDEVEIWPSDERKSAVLYGIILLRPSNK